MTPVPPPMTAHPVVDEGLGGRRREADYLRKLDAERIAALTAEERDVVVKAYRRHKVMPLAHVPRKHGERLKSLGMAVGYEVDGWFRQYTVYSLSIFGGQVARMIAANHQEPK